MASKVKLFNSEAIDAEVVAAGDLPLPRGAYGQPYVIKYRGQYYANFVDHGQEVDEYILTTCIEVPD